MGKRRILLLCLAAALCLAGTSTAESTETAGAVLPAEYAEYRLIAESSRYEMYLYEPTISLLLRTKDKGALIASTLNEHTA